MMGLVRESLPNIGPHSERGSPGEERDFWKQKNLQHRRKTHRTTSLEFTKSEPTAREHAWSLCIHVTDE